MSDLYNKIEQLKTKQTVVKNQKVARFSYTDAAYVNDDAEGALNYDFYEEQNVPLESETNLRPIVLDKGIRAQSASLPRNMINHFFGRVSYNLNKLNDWINSFLLDFLLHMARDGNRYSPTTAYKTDDWCTFVDTEHQNIIRYFVRISTTPSDLIGSAPLISGSVNTTHWKEQFEERFVSLEGRATAVEGRATAVEGRLDTAEPKITALEESIDEASSTATANRLMLRDANGRSQTRIPTAEPSALADGDVWVS